MTKEPIKIACIGEVMIELILREDGSADIGVGGDTYNTAVYLAKTNEKGALDVSYVTALGTDVLSDRILDDLRRHRVDGKNIEHRADRLPGVYAISTDHLGERSFSYWRSESAARTLFLTPCEIGVETLAQYDVVYFSGITLAVLPSETRSLLIDFLRLNRKNGLKVAFDSNYRPQLWEDAETAREFMMRAWSITDIALPSLDDELELFNESDEKEVVDRLLGLGVQTGALKRSSRGPMAIGGKVSENCQFKPVSAVVDTTAAGDSFNAGFLQQILASQDLDQALMAGHELASHVIQARGAIVDP